MRRPRLSFALTAVALLAGCGGESADPPRVEPEPALRIVTLAPALTQMIVDLGRTDLLVGVTDKDTASPSELPIVGNYVDLDSERLLGVRPTHVLQMVPKSGVSAGLRDLASRAGFEVHGYPYPNTIADVAEILAGRPGGMASIGEAIGEPERAARLVAGMARFFDQLRVMTADRGRPRVLLAIGTNPLMASGPGTVNDEVLAAAGGTNVAAGASVSAPTYDREGLLALDPQVILVLSPGRQSTDAQAMASLLPELRDLPVAAVRDGRVVLINDPATLLPSTSLPRIAVLFTKAVHPELGERADALLAEYGRVLGAREQP